MYLKENTKLADMENFLLNTVGEKSLTIGPVLKENKGEYKTLEFDDFIKV